RWFHVTGITAALSDGAAETVAEAMRAAKTAGVSISVDLNYRAKLWSREDAARVMSSLLPMCDVLMASEADAELLFGITGDDFPEVAKGLSERFGVKTVVGPRREASLVWRNRFAAVAGAGGPGHEAARVRGGVVGRLGGGGPDGCRGRQVLRVGALLRSGA